MNDAEYEAEKARIEALVNEWEPILGLRWWSMVHEYCREGLSAEFGEGNPPTPQTVAQTKAKWHYLQGHICFNVPLAAEMTDDELRRTVIHESTHVLVNELRDEVDDWLKHEERVCSTLTSAILWAYEAGRKSVMEVMHER